MSYPQTRFNVFNGTENVIKVSIIEVTEEGAESPLDTSTVSRALLTVLSPTTNSVDSQGGSEFISWDQSGVFTVKLGGLGIEPGTWKFRLIVTDQVGGNHQLVHESLQDALIEVQNTTLI